MSTWTGIRNQFDEVIDFLASKEEEPQDDEAKNEYARMQEILIDLRQGFEPWHPDLQGEHPRKCYDCGHDEFKVVQMWDDNLPEPAGAGPPPGVDLGEPEPSPEWTIRYERIVCTRCGWTEDI